MKNNLAKINYSNDELKAFMANKSCVESENSTPSVLAVERNLTTLRAKIDQHVTSCKTSEARNISIIIEKLNHYKKTIGHQQITLESR